PNDSWLGCCSPESFWGDAEGETFSTKTGIIDPGYNNTVTAVSRPPKSSIEAARDPPSQRFGAASTRATTDTKTKTPSRTLPAGRFEILSERYHSKPNCPGHGYFSVVAGSPPTTFPSVSPGFIPICV